MSITITATGNDGGSVNLAVQSGIGPVGPQGVLVGGTGIDASFANGNSTVALNATLSDLTDVSAAAPSAGQVLEWNGTQWAPGADTTLNLASATPSNLGTAAAGSGSAAARDDHVHAMPALQDLTDINLGSPPSSGEVLTYNGSAWVAAADSTNLTGYATESFVTAAVANLVDSSPAALDTLNELAAALGDDANFAANVTASLAGKAAANHTHTSADITDFATAAAANAPIQTVNNATGDIVIGNGTGLTLTANGSTLTLAAALPPSDLADLADVSGSPAANQALIYTGTEWQPGNIPAGTTINSLSGDLTLANGTGLTLVENGSTLTLSAAIPPSNLADLADVSAASPSTDQILIYNGTAWAAGNNSGGTTVNTLAGAVTLVAGGNISISEAGQNITIAATASGLQGADGAPANITLGDITTLAAGSTATATITGTAPDYTLNFGIPAGATGSTGPQGDAGPTTNLTIGTVTTGTAGSNASATISGTAPDLTLNLTIPEGAVGATGSTGPQGDAGPTTNLTIGTVTTGTAGSNATATVDGTPPNLTLNLTIPRGDTGANGTSGMSLGLFFALS